MASAQDGGSDESRWLFGSDAQRFQKSVTKRGKKRRRLPDDADTDRSGENVSQKMSAKVLAEAEAQQEEEENEQTQSAIQKRENHSWATLIPNAGSDDDDDDDKGTSLADDASETGHPDDIDQAFDPAADITDEDERALAAFASSAGEKHSTLADIVAQRVRERHGVHGESNHTAATGNDASDEVVYGLDPQVANVYRQVGAVMAQYKSGKVPKALKIVPSLSNWEDVLFLTSPENWTPHAVYQATRIFASNLNAAMAQRFYSLVLLPRFREDVQRDKRVHFTMFQALKKALYKPGAFYKGILLPLCQARDCTLREAVILSSVMHRKSIPVAHSSAALLKIAEMAYSGTNSFFIKTLLDKKYALPHRVIDSVVKHFMAFESDSCSLPVVWHQSLLTFVQRYKHEIRADDKERLRRLIRTQRHYLVSPEIARELSQGQSRGETNKQRASVLSAKKAVPEDMHSMPSVRAHTMDVEY